MNYTAPWWLPGGNLQTIWAARMAVRFVGAAPTFRRERWATPDHDFIDVDFLDTANPTLDRDCDCDTSPPLSVSVQPLLVVFHGLEGSSQSHYCQALAAAATKRGWACCIPHFRGCSGELNNGPRAYHSGDFEELDWILRRLQAQHSGPLLAVGISLGGNALMRWAGELGSSAALVVRAVASVSSPLDLAAGGWAIGRGFNRHVYTRMFLRSMVPKALQKLDQHPGLFSRSDMLAVRDIYAFDNIFTAPLHGFKNTDDYYQRASAKPHLQSVAVPALALNAVNDPFIPAWSLPTPAQAGHCVTLWQPRHGGHVGFPESEPPFGYPAHVRAMPDAVTAFLGAHL